MEYATLVATYEKLDATTKRLEMTAHLADLFEQTDTAVIERLVSLTQSIIAPHYEGIELGIAEKIAIRAIAFASGIAEKDIDANLKKAGDIGIVAEQTMSGKKQQALFSEPLSLDRVFSNLMRIATSSGPRSQDLKAKLLADLLHDATPKEARYIMRTVTGNLRLGIADMTIIDALATWQARRMHGTALDDMDDAERRATIAEFRAPIETAYAVHPDLGGIAHALATEGMQGMERYAPRIGIPLQSMLAERLSTAEQILEKMGGRCAVEYKYDGLRMQVHIDNGEVTIFTRRLERITGQFPDIVDAIREAFSGASAIFDAECVGMNLNTGDILPFQEIAHRRGRKHGISEATEEYPAVLFVFDCLYLNGASLLDTPYTKRRATIKKVLTTTQLVRLAESKTVSSPKQLDAFFSRTIEHGSEGIVAKGLDTQYRAGARGWQWIKYKRDYKAEMNDSVDLVAVGAFAGQGRRSGTYGTLLMAAYNEQDDIFETVTKLGSGFTDDHLAKLPELFRDHLIDHAHPRVKSEMDADFWFTPALVLEVVGAEVTLSPIHTCAHGAIKEDAGLAIRFPRFTGRWRDDKSPEEATTSKEIVAMYKARVEKT